MPSPSHGPDCQSRTFPTDCLNCAEPIFIYQCSCKSTVLFDELGNGWPRHACSPATHVKPSSYTDTDVFKVDRPPSRRAQKKTTRAKRQQKSNTAGDFNGIKPTEYIGDSFRGIAHIRELPSITTRVQNLAQLGGIGKLLLGLTDRDFVRGNLLQMTLEASNDGQRRTFTAIVSASLLRGISLTVHMPVGVTIEARGVPTGPAEWFVTSITPIQ